MLAFLEAGRPFAVATVLVTDGSTPVKAGAKAIIEADGAIHGTIGGGQVEANARRVGCGVVQSGNPLIFDFDLRGTQVQESQPICGGAMRVLVAPSSVIGHADCRAAADALAQRGQGVWLTTLAKRGTLQVESRFVTQADLVKPGAFPGAEVCAECLARETPHLAVWPGPEQREAFVEPLIPPPVLLIVGGGHVGQAVAAQASLLEFEIVVIDDRPEFTSPALFPPGVQTRCGSVAEEIAAFPVSRDTFVVIVTRGHQHDAVALRACLRRPAAYIGMIGSRRKVPLLRREFIESGWATAEEFDRAHAPIGLDIGAVTVPEIAASIMAQVISARRQGAGPRIPLK
jgi:xanthine dehydrogenase accessory factor